MTECRPEEGPHAKDSWCASSSGILDQGTGRQILVKHYRNESPLVFVPPSPHLPELFIAFETEEGENSSFPYPLRGIANLLCARWDDSIPASGHTKKTLKYTLELKNEIPA